MSADTLRTIIVVALINAALFYALVIIVFLIARKTRLNKALATQKAFWLAIVVWTLSFILWQYRLSRELQAVLWTGLSLATWWVFVEVFLTNRPALRAWWHDHRPW
jgi:hypothetical protein